MRSRLDFDDPSALDTPVRTPASSFEPAFVGQLAVGVGARLLLQLLTNRNTGRLVVETTVGDPRTRATLVFVHGEPAWVEPVDGAAALFRQLGDTATGQSRRTLAAGAAALARTGARPVTLLEAARSLVAQHTRAVVESVDGSFSFFDEPGAPDHVPLTPVSPFGVLVAAHRRRVSAEALLASAERIASAYLTPLPGLAALSARITPFTGHIDIAPLVDGTRRGRAVYDAMGMDALAGGLVLSVLVDAGVLSLAWAPRQSPRPFESSVPRPVPLGDATDMTTGVPLAALGTVEQELLSLYLELKPERDHTALLGVDIDCKRAALDRAYEARLAQLDARLVPPGPARPALLARIEELRGKIDRAYKAHAARTPREERGAYTVLERVGVGGMAEVYRARSTEDGRIVAIKRIRPENKDDGEFARKLLDEARLARRVRHPNVVRTHNAGKSGDDLYIAMDWVEGADLHGLLAAQRACGERTPLEIACRIVADASGGLHAAHSTRDGRGGTEPILHCDVSTSNILVSLDGVVKLTDFGIARALGRAPGALPSDSAPRSGLVLGKLPYLSAEILEGHEPSVRSDVYAMGMSLYAALMRLPFVRDAEIQTMRAVLRDPLPPASSLRPDVPASLDAILKRACARDPKERTASAQVLQLELEEWLAGRAPPDVGAWARRLKSAPHKAAAPA